MGDDTKTYIETDEYEDTKRRLDEQTERAERASESIRDLRRKIEERLAARRNGAG